MSKQKKQATIGFSKEIIIEALEEVIYASEQHYDALAKVFPNQSPFVVDIREGISINICKISDVLKKLKS